MYHVDVQGSLAYILHHPAKLSVLREGILVFVEEGEDDHDAYASIDQRLDRLQQTVSNNVRKKHHHEEQDDEGGHDHGCFYPLLCHIQMFSHQYSYAEEYEQTPVPHAEIGEQGSSNLGSLDQNMGVTEEIEYDCNGYEAEVFGVLAGVTGYHHGEVIEQEEEEQLDGEPVPAGGDMPQGIVRMMVVDTEQEAEHYRGDDELHEFLTEQRAKGATCPLYVFLVGDEAADEEEEDEIEVDKDMMKRMSIVHMIPVPADMGIYYEVHAETAKGINVFNSFGWHWK